MHRKTLLVLGGTPYQMAPIRYARAQGHRVITCDYLPSNPGHRLADAYFNVSTTDREGVLALARSQSIDGILAFASDPAAPTAAYVAKALGLPGNPLPAVEILTRKDDYRAFLRAHGFHAPAFMAATTLAQARQALAQLKTPVMVKPVDSSGSKGVSRVEHARDMPAAFARAQQFSRCGSVIVETWVERAGYQIAGDGFVVQGRLAFHCLAQEHFNTHAGRYVPAGESFPLQIAPELRTRIVAEIQRLIDLLGLRDGALNFDVMVDTAQRIHLMEVGPRSGGNMIPEVIQLATGVDLAGCAVDAALGLDCSALTQIECQGCYASAVLHAERAGIFERLTVNPALERVDQHLFVQPGRPVQAYEGSHCSLGLMILRFSDPATMLAHMDHLRDDVRVHLHPTPKREPLSRHDRYDTPFGHRPPAILPSA